MSIFPKRDLCGFVFVYIPLSTHCLPVNGHQTACPKSTEELHNAATQTAESRRVKTAMKSQRCKASKGDSETCGKGGEVLPRPWRTQTVMTTIMEISYKIKTKNKHNIERRNWKYGNVYFLFR